MDKPAKIFVSGHRGLVGSAICRHLQAAGYTGLITRTRAELDLQRQQAVESFFQEAVPEYVLLAAAKVGGIWANSTFPAEFIYQNLAIQTHVIHAAWQSGVKRLLFLGSSCIYPRDCPQPMREAYLLSGPLEGTNRPYALAKIAGIEQCSAYNRQYGTQFLAVMPTNLYGPHDNFDLQASHVLPALIRKFHLARLASEAAWGAVQADQQRFGPIPPEILEDLAAIALASGHPRPPFLGDSRREPRNGRPAAGVTLWGTGTPRRELLHIDDLADACLFLMNLEDANFSALCQGAAALQMPLVNIGSGADHSIQELAKRVAAVVGYQGPVFWDRRKPDGTPRKLLDGSRLKDLGWTPKIPLDEGIPATYRWYLGGQ
jgi:GDP-L-fucose synthase